MKTKRGQKPMLRGRQTAVPVRDLTDRKGSHAKGGSMLQSTLSNAIKSIGEGLATVARKG